MGDWQSRALREVSELRMGQSPPGSIVYDLRDGLPFLQGNAEFGAVSPEPRYECDLAPRRAAAGDALISVRAPVGALNIANAVCGIGRGLAAVRFIGIDGRFGAHALAHAAPNLQRVSQGTTFAAIGRTELGSLMIDVPPLEEQRRIAEILDTIDETIQATERVIAKLALTRVGVLRHQLSGLLEGPMSPLSDLGAEVTVGIVVRPTQYYVTDGVPVLRSANVREGGLEMTNLVFMSAADHALMGKTAVKPGDLVTVRTGYPGTTAVVPDSVPEANCVDIVITRTGSAIDPEFLSLWVNSDFGKGHVLARQGGLAQQHFNVGDMKALPVPVLDRPEQQRLVAVRNALVNRLRTEESGLSKLRRTRAGLADDLLSGRVRTVAV